MSGRKFKESHKAQRCEGSVISPWYRNEENPIVVNCHALLDTKAKEAEAEAKTKIFESLCGLCEHQVIRAHIASAYVVKSSSKLIPIALHNNGPTGRGIIKFDEQGIVPRTARTGQYSNVPRVEADPDYFEQSEFTQSELALPVMWQNKVIGVINLESRQENGFNKDAEDIVRNKIPELTQDMLVLWSLFNRKQWCPWNPRIHGWDIRVPLSEMLASAVNDLSDTLVSYTIWYPDWRNEQVFAYATHGYDWEYLSKALPMNTSELGSAFQSRKRETIKLDVSKFKERQKAHELGIEAAYIRPAFAPRTSNHKPLVGVSAYFRNVSSVEDILEENDRAIGIHALDGLCTLLRYFIRSYRRQKRELASAHLNAINQLTRSSVKQTKLEEWMEGIREIFDSPAASVFIATGQGSLKCMASTGFYDLEHPTRCFDFDSHSYDLERDAQTHTVAAFLSCGEAIRRNMIGLPATHRDPRLPFRPSRRHAEFIAGEQLRKWEHSRRKILLCAIGGKVPVGVVRLVRGEEGKLFTHGDAKLLEELCVHCVPDVSIDSQKTPIEEPESEVAR